MKTTGRAVFENGVLRPLAEVAEAIEEAFEKVNLDKGEWVLDWFRSIKADDTL